MGKVTLASGAPEKSPKVLKVIVVGAQSPCCHSISWSQINDENFVDYDVVILILRDLPGTYGALTYADFGRMKTELQRLIASGGKLFVTTSGLNNFNIRHSPQVAKSVQASISGIIPVPVSIRVESGDTVHLVQGKPFSNYLSHVSSWGFWAVNQGQGAKEDAYLRNREGGILAGYFSLGNRGMTLLPDIAALSTDEVASLILAELGIRTAAARPPDWTKEYLVPGLDEVDQQLSDCRASIQKYRDKLAALKNEWQSLANFRKLLYATGDELHEIVDEVFIDLGAKISEVRFGVEDSLLTIDEQLCVVEVTGTESSLKLSKVRQLLDHALIVEEQTSIRPKAILVANPLKNLAPRERDDADPAEFPPNVLERMKETKSALIPSRWLFKKYFDVINGKTNADAVLTKILNTKGLVN